MFMHSVGSDTTEYRPQNFLLIWDSDRAILFAYF